MNNEIVEWRDIPFYEGLYKASSDGRIYGLKRRKELKRVFDPNWGRYVVTLGKDGWQRKFNVSWLIASAFLGVRPEGHDVHHKNETPADDSACNLEYLPEHKHLSLHRLSRSRAKSFIETEAFEKRQTSLAAARTRLSDILTEFGEDSEDYQCALIQFSELEQQLRQVIILQE